MSRAVTYSTPNAARQAMADALKFDLPIDAIEHVRTQSLSGTGAQAEADAREAIRVALNFVTNHPGLPTAGSNDG